MKSECNVGGFDFEFEIKDDGMMHVYYKDKELGALYVLSAVAE